MIRPVRTLLLLSLLIPALLGVVPPPSAHAVTVCSPDDEGTSVKVAQRCVAGITLSARGRLNGAVMTAGKPTMGDVYTNSDTVRYAQEYTVQARLIAWINATKLYGGYSIEGIAGGIEWEVTLPEDKRRPDLLLYEIGRDVEVIEVKGSWYKSQSERTASNQALGYVNTLRSLSTRIFRLAPQSSPLRSYVDDFYIGDRCAVSGAAGFEYATAFSTSNDGVIWSERRKTSCGADGRAVVDANAPLPAWLDQLEKIDWPIADAQADEGASTIGTAPLKMLVLGDSYAAGNGARDESGKPAYIDPYCYRSNYNWASLYASSLSPRAELTNRACSGATTDDYWNAQKTGPSPLSPNEGQFTEYSFLEPSSGQVEAWATQHCGASAPYSSRKTWMGGAWVTTIRCFDYAPAQKESITENYDVIFVSLGGNDLKFEWAVVDCFLVAMPTACDIRLAAMKAETDSVMTKVRNVLADVATRNKHARIVYVGYPRLELNPTYLDYMGAAIRRSGEAFRDSQARLISDLNADPALNGPGVQRFVFADALEDVAASGGVEEPTGDLTVTSPNRATYEFVGDLGAALKEYYHYRPQAHRQVAALLGNLSLGKFGDTSFGMASSALLNSSVTAGRITGTVGSPVRLDASPDLDGYGTYVWDIDGIPGVDVSSPNSIASYAFADPFTGSGSVTLMAPDGTSSTAVVDVEVTADGDQVTQVGDNCPTMANYDQSDLDGDGVGDVCDPNPGLGMALPWGQARSYGDPHLVTVDGLAYDLQSVGEFHAVLAAGADIQVRFVPMVNSRKVSMADAVAVATDLHRIEMRRDGTVLLDGAPQEQSGMLLDDGTLVTFRAGVAQVQTRLGIVTHWDFSSGTFGVTVPASMQITGLFGNNNAAPNDDLRMRDGTAVAAGDTAVIHGPFADSWRINDSESLFTYGAGMSTASYTDTTFPSTVVRLADYTPAELDAANAECVVGGVNPGPAMEACALDALAVANSSFIAAAAGVPAGVVDPTSVRFDSSGLLSQSFDAGVSSNFSAGQYLRVSTSSLAAGAFFDGTPYQFALVSVPRHSQVTLSARLLVLGDTETDADAQTVSVDVDGVATAVMALEGAGSVIAGPAGTSALYTGAGTLVDGTAYRAYDVKVPVAHSTDAMKVSFSTSGFHAVLGTGLAIDEVSLALTTIPPDVKGGLVLPFAAGATQGTGLGSIEQPGGADEYRFSLETQRDVLIETGQAPGVRVDLVETATGEWVAPSDRSNHQLYRGLGAGDYSVVVTAAGKTVQSYAFDVLAPTPQSFTYTVGDHVTNGMIGAVVAPGAGNLETTASEDVYLFTVPTGGQQVVFDSDSSFPVQLERISDGSVVGPVNDHHVYDLAEGTYRIVTAYLGRSGTYQFTAYVKPDPQVFTYQLGDYVTNGMIGSVVSPGAGNLETSASQDVYLFTVPTGGQQVVFDSDSSFPIRLERVDNGTQMGSVVGHQSYALTAGDYRIVAEQTALRSGTYQFTGYVKPDPQVFTYRVGDYVGNGMVGSVASPGAGNLESSASQDVYLFTVPTGGQQVVFDSDSSFPIRLERVDGSQIGSVVGHHVYALTAGDYRIVAEQTALRSGTYQFTSLLKPEAQVFTYRVGDYVGNGMIGAVVSPGAGNLETTASQDVYLFTVPTGGQQVVFDSDAYATVQLERVVDGIVVGPVNGHHIYALDAGDYRIVAGPRSSWSPSGYQFTGYVKPDAQVFAYRVGDYVGNGMVGSVVSPGAGNLETSASQDVYLFTVPTGGQQVVFDSDSSFPIRLERVDNGALIGSVVGHHIYALTPGDYRIVAEQTALRSGAYQFGGYVKPDPQVFTYQVGDHVTNGMIGSVVSPGAGNLETSASQDVYLFTVPTGGQQIVFDSDSSFPIRLERVDNGTLIGSVVGHHVYALTAGDYRIVAEQTALRSGTYQFTSGQ